MLSAQPLLSHQAAAQRTLGSPRALLAVRAGRPGIRRARLSIQSISLWRLNPLSYRQRSTHVRSMPPRKAEAASALMSAYLAQRENLVRAFSARLGSREAAEDLIQDLGRRLVEIDDFDHVHTPGAYLYRLACNLMLDNRRRDGRALRRDGAWRRDNVVMLADEPVAESPEAEAALDARRRLGRLVDLLDELPPKVRRAFELHKLEGRSQAETARLMQISRSGVEKHMMTALRFLTARLT